MADSKISALPASTVPLAGTEVLPIVQSNTTKQVSVANLTAGRTFDALGMTLTSTDAGATEAPLLDLYRDSASPAASDTLGEIIFNGEDSAGNKQKYGCIHGSILSPTSGAEQGQLHFETATGGASTEKMIIGTTNLVINDIGAVYNVRIEGDADANLLYTDATNDRVGVGTISPSTKLQVAGTVTATGVVNSALTSGRVTYAGTSGVLQDGAKLTFDGSNLTVGVSGLAANADGATGKLVLRKPNEANGNPQITRMLDFAPYYPGFDEAVIKASISAGIDSGTQNGQLGFMVALGGVLAQKMGIASDGIVTMSAYGAGAATFSAAGVISSVSDETWKVKDGVPTNPDEMLQKLEPGYWFYNDEKKNTFGEDRQLGFYAQNVREAIGAEAAPTPEEGKPWGYYDRSVLAVTVMSLQNALKTIEELTQRIAVLENKVG